MHQLLDDLRYKSKNAYSALSYRVQDLWRDPKGRVRLIAAGVLSLTLLVLVVIQLARWLTPPPPPPGGIQEARSTWVAPGSWAARARDALAADEAFAGITINETGRGDNKGVRVRGQVPDMAARLECMRLLGELGVPENLDLDITVDPASIKPGP